MSYVTQSNKINPNSNLSIVNLVAGIGSALETREQLEHQY